MFRSRYSWMHLYCALYSCLRAPESGSGSAEKLGVSRRHVLSFLTDDPNPVFGRMDLPFNAKLFDGGLAYKSTQLWFFQDPLSAQFPWFSISRFVSLCFPSSLSL